MSKIYGPSTLTEDQKKNKIDYFEMVRNTPENKRSGYQTVYEAFGIDPKTGKKIEQK